MNFMRNNSKGRKMFNKKILAILCMSTFTIIALASIPLFVSYIHEISPKFALFTDLHVWFGTAFIIFVLIRIISNRQFVKTSGLGSSVQYKK